MMLAHNYSEIGQKALFATNQVGAWVGPSFTYLNPIVLLRFMFPQVMDEMLFGSVKGITFV